MPKLTPSDLRKLLPAAARSCYLNAAGSSPMPLPVQKAINDFHQDLVERGDAGFEGWLRKREEVRGRLARFIGARREEVAFIGSTSLGFHLVGNYLRERGVREVVTLQAEFPSTTLPLLHLGLTLRVVKARADGSYAVEDIAAAIGRKTGAVVLSAVQYSSGFASDLGAIGELCRAKRIHFAVNGAQALGQYQIDVDKHGIDFLCATSHKWMMGGYGVGMFYARGSVVGSESLPMAGWLSVDDPMAMDNLRGARVKAPKGATYLEARGAKFRSEATALEVGTSAFGTQFGIGAALELHEGLGRSTARSHNAKLQKVLRAGLRERGFRPNIPDDPARVAGICVFPVEGDAAAAVKALGKHGVVVTPRAGGVRVSTHVFNTEEDVERLFWAIGKAGVRPRK